MFFNIVGYQVWVAHNKIAYKPIYLRSMAIKHIGWATISLKRVEADTGQFYC